MNIEYTLLGRLARVPSSGYELGRWLQTDGKYYGFKSSLSPIYRCLAALEKRGAIEHRVDSSDDAPDAKTYFLTVIGRQELVDWANSEYVPSDRPMDPDFMQRFLWAGQFGRDIAIRILRTELEFRLAQRAEDVARWRSPEATSPIPEVDIAWADSLHQLSHERGYTSTSLYLSWLELTLARLEHDQAAAPMPHQDGPLVATENAVSA